MKRKLKKIFCHVLNCWSKGDFHLSFLSLNDISTSLKPPPKGMGKKWWGTNFPLISVILALTEVEAEVGAARGGGKPFFCHFVLKAGLTQDAGFFDGFWFHLYNQLQVFFPLKEMCGGLLPQMHFLGGLFSSCEALILWLYSWKLCFNCQRDL